MKIPAQRTARPSAVCPAGKHPGEALRARRIGGGVFEVDWRIAPKARKRTFEITQRTDLRGLRGIAADLGLGGQELELDDIAGRCTVLVRTFGGGSSARVMDTEPA